MKPHRAMGHWLSADAVLTIVQLAVPLSFFAWVAGWHEGIWGGFWPAGVLWIGGATLVAAVVGFWQT